MSKKAKIVIYFDIRNPIEVVVSLESTEPLVIPSDEEEYRTDTAPQEREYGMVQDQ
jgi:hypothetical protein